MSYLVLARKYRPATFADVIGQRPVVRTLENALKAGRVAHALLFSGVRGTGKTTLARIMARALNCEHGPTPLPCNDCPACTAILSSTSMDLHEIDGASNRGIQEIRELKENLRVRPVSDRYKVIIIDEVHMLTNEAFNALLKTLEEPPDHVFFMFATTELHKIPVTILSRCQRYELQRVSFDELKSFFMKISQGEGVDVDDKALDVITREAGGSVRDGLSLLDQAFSFVDSGEDGGRSHLTHTDLLEMMGLVDSRVVTETATALLGRDLATVFRLVDDLLAHGVDLYRFAGDLVAYFRLLVLCRVTDSPERMSDVSEEELQRAKDLAAGYSREELYRFFHIFLKDVEGFRFAANPRFAFEMACIRLVETRKVSDVEEVLAALRGFMGQSDSGGGQMQAPPTPSPPLTPQPVEKVVKTAEPAPFDKKTIEKKESAEEKKTEKKVQDAPVPEVTSEPIVEKEDVPLEENTPQQLQTRDVRARWDEFLAYVKDRKTWMAMDLRHGDVPRMHDGHLLVRFDEPSICTLLRASENVRLLTEFAMDFFQCEIDVQISVRKGSEEDKSSSDISPAEERRALAQDPLVQNTLDLLGGKVEQIRTGPRSR